MPTVRHRAKPLSEVCVSFGYSPADKVIE